MTPPQEIKLMPCPFCGRDAVTRTDSYIPDAIACPNGHTETAKLLIDRVDIEKASHSGMTPFFAACCCCRIEIMLLLIKHRANTNAARDNDATPFTISFYKGRVKILKQFH